MPPDVVLPWRLILTELLAGIFLRHDVVRPDVGSHGFDVRVVPGVAPLRLSDNRITEISNPFNLAVGARLIEVPLRIPWRELATAANDILLEVLAKQYEPLTCGRLVRPLC